MTEALSLADASKAMADALSNTESAPPVEATPTPEGTTPVAETPAAVAPVEAPAVVEYSLDGVDLSGLSEADQKKVKDGFLRQQDYTQKTQEVAPYRKFLEESGTDLDTARKSIEFVHRLENDPDFLRQVAQELQEYASDGTPVNSEQPPVAPENTGTDPNLVNTVQEIAEWKAEQVREREYAELVSGLEENIQKAENAVRESNPTYTEADITEIYALMGANEHDFFKSQAQFEAMRNYFVNQQVKPHLNHPSEANPVNSGTLAGQPKEIKTFEEAAAATRERYRVQS